MRRDSLVLKIYIWNYFPFFYSFNLEIFLCQLKIPFSASPDYYVLGRNIFKPHKRLFLCKSAWRRVSMVNLQYKCVQMSAACKGTTSLVCRIMETCRLAALHSFLGSCVIERKPKLCSSVDLEQMKKEVSFAWAVQGSNQEINDKNSSLKRLLFGFFSASSSEISEFTRFEPSKT